nr:reverse transcriptase domain-containing protein [Tanacetum cinerariifolium]
MAASTPKLTVVPKKLGDHGRFLIPCDFQGLESCMSLSDLGASINLMLPSVWKKLSLSDLTSTRMTLELATRSYAYPAGRPFLRTARTLVDVHGEELILRDGDEQLIFHTDITLKHPHKHGNESINMINLIDITCEDRFPKVLKFKKSNHPSSGSTTPLSDSFPSLTPFETSDSLLEEEIEYLLNQYPSTESNFKTIDPILEKFTDEPALDYLPLPRDDNDDDNDLFYLKSDNDEWKKLLYGDCYNDIDSEKNKNKDSKMKSLVVEAHIVESNDLLPQLLDSDSTLPEESYESFEIATLSSSLFRNEDKVFNPGILILGGTQIFNNESKDKDLRDKDLILEDLIMEYFVKIGKKARILELKRRNMKIVVLTCTTSDEGDGLEMTSMDGVWLCKGLAWWCVRRLLEVVRMCMTRSSTNELFTPLKDPEREFYSSRKLFKTLNLDESRASRFDLFSDLEENSKEEVTKTMAKTMEEYMSKTRADYRSGVTRPKIDDKYYFKLKGQFLKELRDNTFSGSDHEDANEHIEKVLEIVGLFHIINLTQDQIMLLRDM